MAVPWPPNIPISYETETKTTPRIILAKFGDGYEQRSPDWINANPRTVTIKVDQTRAIIQSLAQFLDSTQGSTAITFTPPYNLVGKFVADAGYKITEKGYDYAILEVALREVYEL